MLATDDTFFSLSDSKILKKVSTLPVYLNFSILWGILFLDFDYFLILVCFLKEK